MIKVIAYEDALKTRTRRVHEGIEYFRTEYFRPEGVALDADVDVIPLREREPQAFIVEQIPHSVVGSHFHISNQFQVIVRGSGTLGRHAVKPISVHYAGGYTGYGPITAGEDGLSYFTLRAQFNKGPHFLPEAKPELKDVTRQFLLADDIEISTQAQLAQRTKAVLETIIEPFESGLAGYAARVPCSGSMTAPEPSNGGGQYWVVISGSAIFNGETLNPLSCVFVGPEDTGLSVDAGPSGAEVLILQYPRNPEALPRNRVVAV